MSPRLNDSAIRDALGLTGGDSLGFLPVVTLADFSETLLGEFIEARGFASAFLATSTNGQGLSFGLVAKRGGLIVTDLAVSATVPNSATARGGSGVEELWNLGISAGGIGLVSGAAAIDAVNVGSGTVSATPIASTIDAGGPFGNGAQLAQSFQLQPGVRWFVPGGSTLVVQHNGLQAASDSITGHVTVTWRELAPAAR